MWLAFDEGRSNVGWKFDEQEGWLVVWRRLVLTKDDVPGDRQKWVRMMRTCSEGTVTR